jgi:outer membrane protein assembly factor BamB
MSGVAGAPPPGGLARRAQPSPRAAPARSIVCGIDPSPGSQARPPRRRSAARRRQLALRRALALAVVLVVVILAVWRAAACACGGGGGQAQTVTYGAVPPAPIPTLTGEGVKVGTFLGNYSRRFYGLGPVPTRLDVLWKVRLGEGWTSGKAATDPPAKWAGSGWTGMPNIVVDKGRAYVVVGGYDHRLRRIDALTGKVVWAYKYDDIIKSSPSVFQNPQPTGADDAYIVCAGSRRGYPLPIDSPDVAPYRAVTFGSGKELWRLPVLRTASYSRDCDGSGFYLDGRQYVGVESGWFYALDPLQTVAWNGHQRPVVEARRLLVGDARAASHHGNLVLESSPAVLGSLIYVASGAGHVYGLRRSDLAVRWDYFIGSDLDGTVVPTRRGKLLVPVEKQYIKGHGGVLCLDPTKPPGQATEWFFPTGERKVGEWRGGLIGSCAVNDEYNRDGRLPALIAFNGIDGYLHVVSQDTMAPETVKGPNLEPGLKTPVEVAHIWNGSSISTPLLFNDTIIDAGYDQRVHLYHLTFTPSEQGLEGALPSANGDGSYWRVSLTETDQLFTTGGFESTPTLWNGRVYVGCRDGWFYCLGDKNGQ